MFGVSFFFFLFHFKFSLRIVFHIVGSSQRKLRIFVVVANLAYLSLKQPNCSSLFMCFSKPYWVLLLNLT